MIRIKNLEEILTKYTHFRIKITHDNLRVSNENFSLSFNFGFFKGLCICYCDRNPGYFIPKSDDSNLLPVFNGLVKYTIDKSEKEINCYIIPLGKLADTPYTLKVDVYPPAISKVEITGQLFPNRPETKISREFTDFNSMIIELGDDPQDMVVNSLSQLPTLLEVGDLFLAEPVDRIEPSDRIETMYTISKIQNRVSTTIANLNELMKILENILKELNEIKEDTQRIVDVEYKIDRLDVEAKLNLFIEHPKDLQKNLTEYIKFISSQPWPDEKKDLWADVMIEILEYWQKFKPPKWKSILKGILRIIVGDIVSEVGSDLISSGIRRLFDWIEKIRQKPSGTP